MATANHWLPKLAGSVGELDYPGILEASMAMAMKSDPLSIWLFNAEVKISSHNSGNLAFNGKILQCTTDDCR